MSMNKKGGVAMKKKVDWFSTKIPEKNPKLTMMKGRLREIRDLGIIKDYGISSSTARKLVNEKRVLKAKIKQLEFKKIVEKYE